MTKRMIGIIGALWLVFAPLTAFWLMWRFAFRTLNDYYLGNALIALVLLGPPILIAILYLKYVRGSRD